jgi:hypothetical protein
LVFYANHPNSLQSFSDLLLFEDLSVYSNFQEVVYVLITMAANCVIDRDVLNAETYPAFTEIGLEVFAPLCGRNRGAFVLHPTDGSTWGCAEFPPSFAERAGISDVIIKDSNAVQLQYAGGNITAGEAVELVDLFVQSVFFSSSNVETDVEACDVSGIATLACNSKPRSIHSMKGDKIRAVTLAGVLAPALWATGGKELTIREAKTFYNASDFDDMKALGLNTVEIPVPLGVFGKHTPRREDEMKELLGELLNHAHKSGLGAVIVLVGDDHHRDAHHAIKEAAAYAANSRNVIALTLPSSAHVGAAREASTKLPLFVPATAADLTRISTQDPHVFGALNLDHTGTVADVASASSFEDRLKMFYHESIACSARSRIEYAACYRDVPMYVSSGFDVSIDDCLYMDDAASFIDYGQCGRLDDTVDSHWWFVHRQSLMSRQIFTFEKGLGWTYPAWKLFKDGMDTTGMGVLDSSAKLKCLKHVAAAGIFPSLTDGSSPAQLACLNPPVADFALGDDTVAPTASPPPACDGGWYDFEKKKCAYWIPPPPTSAPTPCPSVEECEPCEAAPMCPYPVAALDASPSILGASLLPGMGGGNVHAHSFLSGVVATLVVGGIVMKLFTSMYKRGRRTTGYEVVPDHVSSLVV